MDNTLVLSVDSVKLVGTSCSVLPIELPLLLTGIWDFGSDSTLNRRDDVGVVVEAGLRSLDMIVVENVDESIVVVLAVVEVVATTRTMAHNNTSSGVATTKHHSTLDLNTPIFKRNEQ
jgi:hypothetical protein